MAFLSIGFQSPCRGGGVLKILAFVLEGKKMLVFVQGGSQKKVSEGVKFSEKMAK